MRWRAAALVAFLANLFLHLPVTDVCDALARRFGFRTFDRVTGLVFAVAGAASLGAMAARRDRAGPVVWALGSALVASAVAVQHVLLVASIENIHYPQYALVAFLLGKSGLTTETTWIVATLLGLADEAYQYLVLRRGRPEYLDWNDILLNALGAAFGVAALLRFGAPRREDRLLAARRAAPAAALALLVAVLASPPVWSPFFRVTSSGRRFRVLSAAEGVGLVALLWLGIRLAVRRHAVWLARARTAPSPRARRDAHPLRGACLSAVRCGRHRGVRPRPRARAPRVVRGRGVRPRA